MQDKPKTKMKAGDLVKLRGHPNLGIILGFKRGDIDRPHQAIRRTRESS